MKVDLTEDELFFLRYICYRAKSYIVDGIVTVSHAVLENDAETIESIINKLRDKDENRAD